jgi:hypothetical protein
MACVLKVNKSMKTRDPIYKLPKCLEVERVGMYYYVEHAIITKLKEEAETTLTVLLEGNSC